MSYPWPIVLAAAVLGVLAAPAGVTSNSDSGPNVSSRIQRIHMVTISSEDPAASARNYEQYFDYRPAESGRIGADLATAWGATSLADRSYVVLRAPGPDRAYLRFVENRNHPAYRALTSRGWNALELLVHDPYALHEKLENSPYGHLDGPAPLTADSSIHAVQYLGPDNEVLYLTADQGPEATSTLPRASQPVERPFIVVVAGESLTALSQFYDAMFDLKPAYRMRLPIPLIARAQRRPVEQEYELSLLRLGQFSHSIELDAYPEAPPRPTIRGELPPGLAVVTLCTLHAIDDHATEIRPTGVAYKGNRVQVVRGAAGELMEILDCDGIPRRWGSKDSNPEELL